METKEIILLTICVAAVGFNLYRRFMKKEQQKKSGTAHGQDGSFEAGSAKDDDYEPYSGR